MTKEYWKELAMARNYVLRKITDILDNDLYANLTKLKKIEEAMRVMSEENPEW